MRRKPDFLDDDCFPDWDSDFSDYDVDLDGLAGTLDLDFDDLAATLEFDVRGLDDFDYTNCNCLITICNLSSNEARTKLELLKNI